MLFRYPWRLWFMVPIVAPIMGALIGGWFYIVLLGSHIPDEEPQEKEKGEEKEKEKPKE